MVEIKKMFGILILTVILVVITVVADFNVCCRRHNHNWGYVEINHSQIDVVRCSKCGKTVRRCVDSDFPTEEYPPLFKC